MQAHKRLNESGSIEQDADVVMFVFREEYYVERLKPSEGSAEFIDWQQKIFAVGGKAEVIIGKQRHGPVGTVELSFESHLTRFGNLARDYQVTPYGRCQVVCHPGSRAFARLSGTQQKVSRRF